MFYKSLKLVILCYLPMLINGECQVTAWNNNGVEDLVTSWYTSNNWWNVCPVSTAQLKICTNSGNFVQLFEGCQADGTFLGEFLDSGNGCITYGNWKDGANSIGHKVGSVQCLGE
jgi:hypothetical protein